MTGADAVISEDGRYRYRLTRSWDDTLPRMTFVMLNPSTADAEVDDPTIRRCIGFAQREDCGALVVVNLYAFRATDPKIMLRAIDAVGPENDAYLADAFVSANGPVVAAWGANADRGRASHVRKLAGATRLHHLGLTKDGHPRHPLYVPGAWPLAEWPNPMFQEGSK